MGTHAAPEVRRAQILEAARGCFAAKGYHAAKMDDIVRASGLSKGSIYWHFKSKEEIFLGIFEAYTEAIFAGWDAIETDDALEALRIEGDIALAQVLSSRDELGAWTEFFRHERARERMAEIYRRTRERLGATIQRGIDAGQIRPCDPRELATALTALIEGLLLQAFVDGDFDPTPAWQLAWQTLGRGLTASSAGTAA